MKRPHITMQSLMSILWDWSFCGRTSETVADLEWPGRSIHSAIPGNRPPCLHMWVDMSEIYIHLKNDYKYYHLQVAWKCSILKVLNLLILFHYKYLSHTQFQYNYCCIFHTAWHVSIFPANFLCFNGTFTISTLKFVDGIWWPIFWTCGLSGQIQQSDYKIHGNGMAGQPQ